MSYKRGWWDGPLGPLVNYQPLAFGSAASLSQIDIAARHNMYGANTTGAGDTICSLTAANGGYTTIWEASGTGEIRFD